ncbi:MAG: type II toxin-antitoxin system RelB/DinJ family antitoxin [Streptococcaceae bacterium]|nr:type II toxin-antitoxin system RelB/DinJ family antitoxin [Streptococcaceae bacterium]
MATVKDTRISFRTNRELRDNASEILDRLQLDMSTALNIFLGQIVEKETLPLDFSNRKKELALLEKMLDEAEADIHTGRVYSLDDAFQKVAESGIKYDTTRHHPN